MSRVKTRARAGHATIDRVVQPLAEGRAEGRFKNEVLAGKIFRIPINAKGQQNWELIPDSDLIELAKAYCKEYAITKKSELAKGEKSESGLYNILRRRKLIDKVFDYKEFEEVVMLGETFIIPLKPDQTRNWAKMSDGEIVKFAKAYCKANNLTKRRELAAGNKSLSRLYATLAKKELLDQIFPRKEFETMLLGGTSFRIPLNKLHKNWAKMSDDEILKFAKAYCKEKGINSISELAKGSKALSGLYLILSKKELLDQVFLREKFEEMVLGEKIFRVPLNSHGKRDWRAMSDNDLIELAKAYCKEHAITKKNELEKGEKSESRLYLILGRRKLIDKVFDYKEFEEVTLAGKTFNLPLDNKGQTNWAKLSDKKMVEFAKAYCKEKGITARTDLAKGEKGNSSLYGTLATRKLLDSVFSDIERAIEAAALDALALALEKF